MDIIPRLGPEEINPQTGRPDHRMVYTSITVAGVVEADLSSLCAPRMGDDSSEAWLTFENGTRIPVRVTNYTRESR